MELKKIIEAAGGRFLRVEGDSVIFQDARDGAELSLYVSAVRCVEDVTLTLKAHRERVNPAREVLA